MDDLISRQAAIDALHTRFRDGFDEDKWWNSTHVLAVIEGLPSAQPEIIYCKDCRKHNKRVGFDENFHTVWKEDACPPYIVEGKSTGT